MKRSYASAVLTLALGIAGCVADPRPRSEWLTHAAITQGGQQLRAVNTKDGIYEYRLQKGPFSVLAPNHDAGGKARGVSDKIDIHICASADPAIFQGIAPGRAVTQLRCLDGAAIMARSSSETAAGVNLMLSKGDGQNVLDAKLAVPGPRYDTVNVSQVMDFKVVGHFCMAPNNTRCIDERAMQPYGAGTIYLIVFTDLDDNHTVDAGEYTLLKLDIAG